MSSSTLIRNLRSTLRSIRSVSAAHRFRLERSRFYRPQLEALEERRVPVVGAFAIPAPVQPGTGFDGVVQLFDPTGSCTGSLLFTGRHILTAAHCVDTNGDRIADPGTYR